MQQSNNLEFDFSGKAPIEKFAFVFVCQKGKLEIMSCLLAASLKKFVKVDFEMIVAVPGPESFFTKPQKQTLDFLGKLGCKFFYFENDFVKQGKIDAHYLLANKIFALGAPARASKIIFLDSDQLCCKDFFGDPVFFLPFSAILSNHSSSADLALKAEDVYVAAGLEIPKIRFKMPYAPAGEQKEIFLPPHFFSGFVAIDANLAPILKDFWLESFMSISEKKFLTGNYFSEEIALSMAVQKMKVPFSIMGFEWKYEKFFVYHETCRIKERVGLQNLVRLLFNENPELKKIARSDVIWAFVLDRLENNKVFLENTGFEKKSASLVAGGREKAKEIFEPFLSKDEIILFRSYLGGEKDKIILEWGAGGSTVEFSKYAKEYYSIEHDFGWYNNISKYLEKNARIFYVPPNTENLEWPPFKRGDYGVFSNYINFVENIASLGKKFDIVLVDGRARVECAIKVLPYLSDDAIVFIHDFERTYYWKVFRHYRVEAVVDKLAVLKKKKNNV